MDIATPVSSALSVIVLAGGASAWLWISARLYQNQPLLLYEPRRVVPWHGVDLLLILGVWIIAEWSSAAVVFGWTGVKPPQDPEAFDAAYTRAMLTSGLAAKVVAPLMAIVLLVARTGSTARDFGLNWRRAPHDVAAGVVAFFAIAPVVFGVQWILFEVAKIKYQHPLIKAMQQSPDTAILWLVTILAVVVAPLVEEFLFRVVLQGWLEKLELSIAKRRTLLASESAQSTAEADRASTGETPPNSGDAAGPHSPGTGGLFGLPVGSVPIIASSLLFAMMHWGHGAAPIPLFLFGLTLGFLYQRTHRLLPSVTVHFLLNAMTMIVLLTAPVPTPPPS